MKKVRGSFVVDVQCPEKLCDFHNDLPVLLEQMKIEKVEKLVPTLHDKTECVIHTKKFKTIFKPRASVIKFNQEA